MLVNSLVSILTSLIRLQLASSILSPLLWIMTVINSIHIQDTIRVPFYGLVKEGEDVELPITRQMIIELSNNQKLSEILAEIPTRAGHIMFLRVVRRRRAHLRYSSIPVIPAGRGWCNFSMCLSCCRSISWGFSPVFLGRVFDNLRLLFFLQFPSWGGCSCARGILDG